MRQRISAVAVNHRRARRRGLCGAVRQGRSCPAATPLRREAGAARRTPSPRRASAAAATGQTLPASIDLPLPAGRPSTPLPAAAAISTLGAAGSLPRAARARSSVQHRARPVPAAGVQWHHPVAVHHFEQVGCCMRRARHHACGRRAALSAGNAIARCAPPSRGPRPAHRQCAAHRHAVRRPARVRRQIETSSFVASTCPLAAGMPMAIKQIKAPDSPGQIGGRRVDSDALVHGPFQCAGLRRGTRALARLSTSRVGGPIGDARQAVGEMPHFHRDGGQAQRRGARCGRWRATCGHCSKRPRRLSRRQARLPSEGVRYSRRRRPRHRMNLTRLRFAVPRCRDGQLQQGRHRAGRGTADAEPPRCALLRFDLRVTLLQRTGRGVLLTEAGEAPVRYGEHPAAGRTAQGTSAPTTAGPPAAVIGLPPAWALC